MKIALRSKNLLTNVAKFSQIEEIKSLKKTKDWMQSLLSSKSNETVNSIYFDNYLKNFKEKEDEEHMNEEREYYLSEELNKINWEEKTGELNEHLEKMKILGEEKSETIEFIFQYHTYLPDLRKSNKILEYINGTLLMRKFYDHKKLVKFQKRYYDKYITEEYMFDQAATKQIIPLREKQHFENELLNFKDSFKELKENTRYLKIFNEEILKYDYHLIENEFKEESKSDLEKINPIFNFIWSITVYFKFYFINVSASILRFKGEKLIIEFIKQHNDVMNVILFIDSVFNNVNIIINYWNKYLNPDNKSGKEFSMIFLFLKMYRELVYNCFINIVLTEFSKYLKNNNENKMVIENDDLSSTNDSSDEESQYQKEEMDEKRIIEDLGNCILDMELNEENANGINHTGIKLGTIYEKYEEILKEKIKTKLEQSFKENNAFQAFEEIKQLLEANKHPHIMLYKNLGLINRTKKILVDDFAKMFTNYLNSKFNFNNNHGMYDSQEEDFMYFSEEDEKKIKKKVENELNLLKDKLVNNYIKEKNIQQAPKNIENLVNDYVDKNGDNFVLLAKKLLYFFYKEKQFYKSNDKRIIQILNGVNDDSWKNFIDEKYK